MIMDASSQLLEQNRMAFGVGAEIGGAYWRGKEMAPKMREQELRNRVLSVQAKSAELEVKTFDQVMTENPLEQLSEVGSLPSDQIPGWLRRHAAWRAVPQLAKMWDGVAESYAKSSEGIASAEFAKKRVGLAVKYGLNPTTATDQDWANATGNENIEEFLKEANTIGKDGSKVEFEPARDFDANGNWLPGAKLRLMKTAPASEAIQSREAIARAQMEANLARSQAMLDIAEFKAEHGWGFSPGALQKDLDYADQRLKAGGLTREQHEKYVATRVNAEPKPSAAAASGKTYYDNREFSALETQLVNLQKALMDIAGSNSKADIAKRNELLGERAKIDRRIRQMRAAQLPFSGTVSPVQEDWVSVISPDRPGKPGVSGKVRRSELDQALKEGYRKAP